jgi:hypothetical protein
MGTLRILHEYMERYERLRFTMFERHGAIRQLIRKDATLLYMVKLWHATSLIKLSSLDNRRVNLAFPTSSPILITIWNGVGILNPSNVRI